MREREREGREGGRGERERECTWVFAGINETGEVWAGIKDSGQVLRHTINK